MVEIVSPFFLTAYPAAPPAPAAKFIQLADPELGLLPLAPASPKPPAPTDRDWETFLGTVG